MQNQLPFTFSDKLERTPMSHDTQRADTESNHGCQCSGVQFLLSCQIFPDRVRKTFPAMYRVHEKTARITTPGANSETLQHGANRLSPATYSPGNIARFRQRRPTLKTAEKAQQDTANCWESSARHCQLLESSVARLSSDTLVDAC